MVCLARHAAIGMTDYMLNKPSLPTPLIAQKRSVRSTHHGITRTDDFGWLRADNWQEVMQQPDMLAADIRRYLEAENEYTEAVMADTDERQKRLFEEIQCPDLPDQRAAGGAGRFRSVNR